MAWQDILATAARASSEAQAHAPAVRALLDRAVAGRVGAGELHAVTTGAYPDLTVPFIAALDRAARAEYGRWDPVTLAAVRATLRRLPRLIDDLAVRLLGPSGIPVAPPPASGPGSASEQLGDLAADAARSPADEAAALQRGAAGRTCPRCGSVRVEERHTTLEPDERRFIEARCNACGLYASWLLGDPGEGGWGGPAPAAGGGSAAPAAGGGWIAIPECDFDLGLTDEEARAFAREILARRRRRADDFGEAYRLENDPKVFEQILEQVAFSRPSRRVHLAGYAIAACPVTEGEYAEFVRAAGAPEPERWRKGARPNPRLPVTGVSWDSARAYAEWREADLPGEAEWERAARGVDRRLFPWGSRYAEQGEWLEAQVDPWPVGEHPELDSPDGAHDLVTRLFEWCADEFTPYPGADRQAWARLTPPEQSWAGTRVRRGGEPGELMPAAVTRRGADARTAFRDTTFRLVRRSRT